MTQKTLIIIPTYNEIDNIKRLVRKIKGLKLKQTDIIFIDDNSPDGTGRLIKKLSKSDQNLFLLSRKKMEGIGSAHLDGINWAYKHNYNRVITLDADLTHNPLDIKKLIKISKLSDLVISSRYLSKNDLPGWSKFRILLNKLSHFFTSIILSNKYDASTAFRLYNIDRIKQSVFSEIKSKRYTFFVESLFILLRHNYTVTEVPGRLSSRYKGKSKIKIYDIFSTLIFYFYLIILKLKNYFKTNR